MDYKAKKPYVGVTLSDFHKMALEEYLICCVFNSMRDPESKIANAQLIELTNKDKPKKRVAAKGKAGPQKKIKTDDDGQQPQPKKDDDKGDDEDDGPSDKGE